MVNDYLSISSEINALKDLLATIPDGHVIERISLESRLAYAKAALAELPEQIAPKARLTFRGKPVFGSHGIAADFGSKAAGAFSDAVAAVTAGLNENLRYMGPIPNRDKNQLLITGTAIGSFGFEFELPAPESTLFPEVGKSQEAMTRIQALFRLAATGTDDEIAEVIDEVHPRAVKKVHDFLELLVQQEAWCGLEFADQFFGFTDYAQIKVSCERLKSENILEREEIYRGEFQGVLPTGRTFEFQQADQKGLIKGKVGVSIDEPDALNRYWLHKPITAKLNVVQVGQGKPRYTLKTLGDLIP